MTFRKPATPRHIRERILILCEGEKTEPDYFRAIKKDTRNTALEIPNCNKNTPKELIEEAINLMVKAKRERNEYKEVWVVFDKDNYTKHHEAFDRARAKDIKIAFSSTCFEFWLLLHFEYTSSPFSDCDNVIRKLKVHIPGYEKGGEHYAILRPKISDAIKNGEKIMAYCSSTNNSRIWEYNPYTDVGLLVEKLLNIQV